MDKQKPKIKGDCPRCGGTGYIPQFHYIDNGRCFQCNGTGRTHNIIKTTKEFSKKLTTLSELYD